MVNITVIFVGGAGNGRVGFCGGAHLGLKVAIELPVVFSKFVLVNRPSLRALTGFNLAVGHQPTPAVG